MTEEGLVHQLGKNYPLASIEKAHKTKERILLESTILFAENGYANVSMKDIAQKTGLKPASLYNHYISKEKLWCAVLEHAQDLYLLYFIRLEQARNIAHTFEQVLESMFVELKKVVNIFTYYAFSLVQTEQLHSKMAGDMYRNTFLKYSIHYIKGRFDECVNQGLAQPFDTQTVATFFMHSVMVGISLRVHEHRGQETPYNITAMYEQLQSYILHAAGKQ